MSDIKIELAKNGFIVFEGESMSVHGGSLYKTYAFESPKNLSDFIYEWGVNQRSSAYQGEKDE